MARARTIKPEFFQNEDLGKLNPLARLLYIGLWCQADRDGYFEDRPDRLKVAILPYDDCDVPGLLADLERMGLIERTGHTYKGRVLFRIPTFGAHQRIWGDQPSLLEMIGSSESTKIHEDLRGRSEDLRKSHVVARPRAREAEARAEAEEKASRGGCKGGCDAEEVATAFNEVLPELPSVRVPMAAGVRAKVEAAIRREGIGLFAWRMYFESIRGMPFLMGKKSDWRASLLWLMGPENKAKVESGAYLEHKQPADGELAGMDYSKGFDDV